MFPQQEILSPGLPTGKIWLQHLSEQVHGCQHSSHTAGTPGEAQERDAGSDSEETTSWAPCHGAANREGLVRGGQ